MFKVSLLVSGGAPWIGLECVPSITRRKEVIQLSLSFQKCGHEYHRMQIISFIDNTFFFFFFYKFIYLFFYFCLGLRFCARAFSSCGKRGPLFITVRGPLTIVASLVAEHRLQTRRLSSCGSRA